MSEMSKANAKELIRKALELQTRMDTAECVFLAEKKKLDKELGQRLNELRILSRGGPAEDSEGQ